MEAFWMNLEGKFFHKTVELRNGKGCLEWAGSRKGNTSYGFMVVKWPGGEEKREAAHRLAYMIRHKLTRYDMPRLDENNNKVECSHLCHHSLCVNADHIVLEPHAINLERLHCKNQGLCSKCHKPYCLICNLLIFKFYFRTDTDSFLLFLPYGWSSCLRKVFSHKFSSFNSIFFSYSIISLSFSYKAYSFLRFSDLNAL